MWCWARDADEGWRPKRGRGEWMFTQAQLETIEDDVVMLPHINEAQILHNLREARDYPVFLSPYRHA